MIQIEAVRDIGEIGVGIDLAAVLADALAPYDPVDGDILVVTQKILSKAEGRRVSLKDLTPGERALELAAITGKDPRLVELVLAESTHVVRTGPNVLITRHRLGLVMANAGIDASNIGTDEADLVLLLPEDPDASATHLRQGIEERLGVKLGIIVSDSFGRPWRYGVVNVAIGAAGLPAIIDRRGGVDRDGRILQVTQIAYGDLIASASGLAMGEAAEGIPAALVRGCTAPEMEYPASHLIRPLAEDLFR